MRCKMVRFQKFMWCNIMRSTKSKKSFDFTSIYNRTTFFRIKLMNKSLIILFVILGLDLADFLFDGHRNSNQLHVHSCFL